MDEQDIMCLHICISGPTVWKMIYFQEVKEETIKRRKINRFCQILRRTCFLKRFTEGKTEGTGRRRIKSRQLLDDCKEARRYGNFKVEALYRRLWRTGFVTGYRPVVIQIKRWWSEGFLKILRTTSKSLTQGIVFLTSIRTGNLPNISQTF